MKTYLLDDKHQPIPCDPITCFLELEGGKRIVCQEKIGRYWLSTVFLGVEHGVDSDGNPLLFETMMTLDDEFLDKQWRYATWDEALASHHRIAEQLRCI